jgi:hypothetical protein
MDNILTLALEGEITLADFSEAMKDFGALVAVLSQERAGTTKIDWRIDDLTAGRAIATIRGDSPNREMVEAVVRAVGTVGSALQHQEPILTKIEVAGAATEYVTRILSPAVEQKIDALWNDKLVIGLIELHDGIAMRARDLTR